MDGCMHMCTRACVCKHVGMHACMFVWIYACSRAIVCSMYHFYEVSV